MQYKDAVYDQVKISEPVVLDLIKSPYLQRLKGVNQAGYAPAFYPRYKNNRFSHSVGVYLLLKKFNASLEEQVAGLIHDVSHSSFSHAIDYILKTGSQAKQSHQDSIFKKFISDTDIPTILKKHQLDPNFIFDDKNFHLKETNLPSLCADRIDYSFRDAILSNSFTKKYVNQLLSHLIIDNRRWVFDNLQSGLKFARFFKKLNTTHWASLTTAAMFKTVGDCLGYALKNNYLTPKDLYKTDDFIISIIKKKIPADPQLKHLFNRMSNKVPYKNDPQNFEEKIVCKSRAVDPLVKHQNKTKPLSQAYPQWKSILQKESQPKEYFLKFEDYISTQTS
jgi:hypothetical protein